jgi:phospholipid-translocating ATPase
MDNESFPASTLICTRSEDGNVAFIEMKNLDGETNLKAPGDLDGKYKEILL